MAHELKVGSAPGIIRQNSLETEEIWEARVDLAASLRMCARLGLHEGIDNHFSALVPGRPDLMLINPYGFSFHEAKASNVVICDFEGNVVSGDHAPEASAFYIHARLHKLNPKVGAAFHTHMPYATALSMVEGQPFEWAGQMALKFYGRTAVYEEYNGLALDESEGDRIAAAMGDADILFMRNHGVMVCGPTIAEAWDDLYFVERAAEVQVKAMSTGRKLIPIAHEVARKVYDEMREADPKSARLHLDSVRRLLAQDAPEFAS